MIEAHELRVGNLLNLYWSHSVWAFDEIQINANDILTIEQKKGGYEHYKTIPITEEILLLKFGFNKEYKKGWIGIDVKHDSGMTTDFILAEPFSMGEWQEQYCFVYDTFRFVPLYYVHDLQNLFFCMNKKELEYVQKP